LKPPPDPYDINTWGWECARGIQYANTGAPVAAGTKNVVRKIARGRKKYRPRPQGETPSVKDVTLSTYPSEVSSARPPSSNLRDSSNPRAPA